MKRVFMLVSVALVLVAPGQLAATACEGELPQSVLQCYESAYAARDVGALEELYADDYQWVVVSPPEATVWDRAKALTSAKKMFEHPAVTDLSLTLEGAPEVVAGSVAGTWRIEGIAGVLTTVFGVGGEPEVARACATLYVREVADSSGSFEVYREVTFGNGDCAAWGRAESEE